MANSIVLKVTPAQITLIGGGKAAPMTNFDTKEPVMRGGRQVKRLAGMTAFLDGVGLENFNVSSVTAIEDFGDGGLMSVTGEVEVMIRAEGKAGFNGGAPRGSLAGTVFVEDIHPVGSLVDLVAHAARRQPAKAD